MSYKRWIANTTITTPKNGRFFYCIPRVAIYYLNIGIVLTDFATHADPRGRGKPFAECAETSREPGNRQGKKIMLVGYARVSTKYQTLDLQTDALKAAGCEEIFNDRISGAAAHRSGLEDCLNYLNPGDTLVVWKIDRLGRSIAHLVRLLDELHNKGIEFRSLTESIDTNTPFGKALFGIIAALTQMERDLIIERTRAGLEAARTRGKKPGKKPIITGKVEAAVLDWQRRGLTVPQIAEATHINRATLYRYFKNRLETTAPEAIPPKRKR